MPLVQSSSAELLGSYECTAYLSHIVLGDIITTDSTFIRDPITNDWTAGIKKTEEKANLKLAFTGSKVCAVGGWKGSEILNTTEVLDVDSDAWHTLAPMLSRRLSRGCRTRRGRFCRRRT